jgi:diguanylate cyclase (GGDEF)-like protein
MISDRWRSVRTIGGGGIIALVTVSWGMMVWDVPGWFIHVVSVFFIFASAILHRRRIYLHITLTYLLAHLGVDLASPKVSFLFGADGVQWLSIAVAGEVIHQISTQRRKTEELSRRRIRELETLNETLASIPNELDLNALLQSITERAVKLLNVSLGELLLYDKSTGEMEIVAQYPATPEQIGFKMKPGEGAMGRVAVTKRPLVLNDYKAFVNALPDEITTGVEATLDVPLLKGDEFIGVLGVGHHIKNRHFTDSDVRLLTVFASQATIAIENARLYREVQHLAFTDVLTGIPNRRRLFELLEKEYKRAVRYHRPLTIILADIDHFKKINDGHGHAAGDEVLRWFAQRCNEIIRQKIDIVGRFGGEEFAIIYPETNIASAISAAERLRSYTLASKVPHNGIEIPVTFSAGIAALPLETHIALDQLLERADRALYCAKETRNCMAYWDETDAAPHRLASLRTPPPTPLRPAT